MFVYQAKNLVNNKCYIGQTKAHFLLRKSQHHHQAFAKGTLSPFYHALRKYGRDVFEWSALYYWTDYSQDLLNILEKYYIKLHNTISPNGYNLCEGGQGIDSDRVSGKKNPRARKFLITDPEGIKYNVHGKLKQFCKEHNLSFQRMYYIGLKENNKIPPGIMNQNEAGSNCTGWEIVGI